MYKMLCYLSFTLSMHECIIRVPTGGEFILIIFIPFAKECYYLVFWPDKSTYSMLPESKIVGEKEPSAGQMVKVKEGQKLYSGKVVAVGKKFYIEKKLSEMKATKEQ